MNVIYGLIPGMLFIGLIGVAILFWAARSGQYDDLDGEAYRILMDEDLAPGSDSSLSKDQQSEKSS